MSILTVDDRLIHYEALGRGEPLLFLHSWLGSWRYWWTSMQALSVHYRAFACDMWGYGDSGKMSENYTFDDYVDLVGTFIDNLGIVRPISIVGHGLGAAVALRYATRNPSAVRRLAAVALPIHGRAIHSRLADAGNMTQLQRLLGRSANHPELIGELHKTDVQAVTRVARELADADFSADLDAAPCPILLVYGGQDPLIQQPLGRFAEAHDQRAFVAPESWQHFPMLEEAATFNRLILDFLRADASLDTLAPKDYWQRRTH